MIMAVELAAGGGGGGGGGGMYAQHVTDTTYVGGMLLPGPPFTVGSLNADILRYNADNLSITLKL